MGKPGWSKLRKWRLFSYIEVWCTVLKIFLNHFLGSTDMSYISFYRKWRPQSFSEVIGQEHVVKTLQNAISKNRLVHGYMFCGPKGTGKTSVARIFAKAINCVHGPAIEPCNKCDNCISITAGLSVDVIEIDAASNRKIEDIRDVRDKVKYLPIVLRKKIYIIDEVHMLTQESFNALLKTLEEPPEHVTFIMATTDPNKVIKTIMSRCQRFDFEPISLEGLRQRLNEVASSENIDITDSALSIVAKYSDGSLRDAEGILEQLSSFSDGRITVDDVSSILGIIDQDMLFELANIILEKNINQGLLFVSRLFSTSFSLNAFVSEFLEHLYNLYIIKNYENPADILDMPNDFKENYYNQAGLFTSGKLENLIDLFSGLLAQIKDSESPKTFFKAAVIKALSAESIKGGPMNQAGPLIKSSHVIKGDQVVKNLKIMDQDIRESNNEPGEVNSGSKNNAEAAIQKEISTETFGTTENVTATAIPGQQKMAAAKNIPDRKTIETAPAKGVVKSAAEDIPSDLKKSLGDFSLLILESWGTLLMKTKEKKVFLEAKLKEVKKFRLQGNKLFLLLEPKNNWHKTELNKTENRALIQELLISLTGEKFEITFDFISDDNISESIDLAHPVKKISVAGDLPQENKVAPSIGEGSLIKGSPEVNAGGSIDAYKKGPDDIDTVAGSDTYEYFEEKFKLREK
jgi:DNA polymerase III subunit gamma/tau